MSNVGQELSSQVTALTSDLVSLVNGCSVEQWSRITSEEGWPVGVAMLHMAEVIGNVAGLAKMDASAPALSLSNEQIDGMNAQRVAERAGVSQAEVAGLLQANGAELAGVAANLTSDQLGRVVLNVGGQELSLGDSIRFAVLGHLQGHAASVRATIGG